MQLILNDQGVRRGEQRKRELTGQDGSQVSIPLREVVSAEQIRSGIWTVCDILT